MGLFGTSKAARVSVDGLAQMVGNYFKRLKLDMESQQLDAADGLGWWLTEGSVKVYIFALEDPSGPVVRITAPILHYPDDNRLAFFERLLEINRELSGCCLAVFQEVVLVSAQRSTLGLDQEELNELIWNVSITADRLDDQLASEFGAMPYNEDPNC